MKITKEQLLAIMPGARQRAEKYVGPLNAAMEEFGIVTKLQVAAFLSQLGHESGQLLYTRELASGKAYTNRADLGNTSKTAIEIAKRNGSETGPFYKG